MRQSFLAVIAVGVIAVGTMDDADADQAFNYLQNGAKTERTLRRQSANQEWQQRRAAMRERAQQDLEQRRQKNRALKAENEERRQAFRAEMAAK